MTQPVPSGYTVVPWASLPNGFRLYTAGGKYWSYSGSYVNLATTGTELFMYVDQPSDIYPNSSGTGTSGWMRINQLGTTAGTNCVRHAGFDCWLNGYSYANYDFSWRFYYLTGGNPNQVIIGNNYPADNIGFYISDSGNGRVRINTQNPASAQVFNIIYSLQTPILVTPTLQLPINNTLNPYNFTVQQTVTYASTSIVAWSNISKPADIIIVSSSSTGINYQIPKNIVISTSNIIVNAFSVNIQLLIPNAMTANSTSLLDGTYIASTSLNSTAIYTIFDTSISTSFSDTTQPGLNYFNGLYVKSSPTITNSITGISSINGEWFQIQLPSQKRLYAYEIIPVPSPYQNRAPKKFYILGSNDGSSWKLLDTQTNTVWSTNQTATRFILIDNSSTYFYYRLIINTIGSDQSILSIAEWKLYTSSSISSTASSTFSISAIGYNQPGLINPGLQQINTADNNKTIVISQSNIGTGNLIWNTSTLTSNITYNISDSNLILNIPQTTIISPLANYNITVTASNILNISSSITFKLISQGYNTPILNYDGNTTLYTANSPLLLTINQLATNTGDITWSLPPLLNGVIKDTSNTNNTYLILIIPQLTSGKLSGTIIASPCNLDTIPLTAKYQLNITLLAQSQNLTYFSVLDKNITVYDKPILINPGDVSLYTATSIKTLTINQTALNTGPLVWTDNNTSKDIIRKVATSSYIVYIFNTGTNSNINNFTITATNSLNISTSITFSLTLFTYYPPLTQIPTISYLGEWIQVQLPSQIQMKLTGYTIYPQIINSPINIPESWYIVGSLDNINWSIIDFKQQISSWSGYSNIYTTLYTSKPYQYFRFICNSISIGTSVALQEFALYGIINNTSNIRIPPGPMTSYNTNFTTGSLNPSLAFLAGTYSIRSSTEYLNQNAWYAFDQDNNTTSRYWLSSPNYTPSIPFSLTNTITTVTDNNTSNIRIVNTANSSTTIQILQSQQNTGLLKWFYSNLPTNFSVSSNNYSNIITIPQYTILPPTTIKLTVIGNSPVSTSITPTPAILSYSNIIYLNLTSYGSNIPIILNPGNVLIDTFEVINNLSITQTAINVGQITWFYSNLNPAISNIITVNSSNSSSILFNIQSNITLSNYQFIIGASNYREYITTQFTLNLVSIKELYSFSNFTFTNLNATGKTGPVTGSTYHINPWSSHSNMIDNISQTARSSARGIYAYAAVYSMYTGPIFKIRRSVDNLLSDFYGDPYGNLGQAPGANGVQIEDWLGCSSGLIRSVGYINTWYDQSSSNNHATQLTYSLQPFIDISLKRVDFTGSTYMNLPNGTVPMNIPYTFIVRHGDINNIGGGIIGAGSASAGTNIGNNLRRDATYGYWNYWYNNDSGANTSYNAGNVVTVKYNGPTTSGNTVFFINGTQTTAYNGTRSGWSGQSGNELLGKTTFDATLNGQLYEVYVFASALNDTDRSNIETVLIPFSSTNSLFNINTGIQYWRVPKTGPFTITFAGSGNATGLGVTTGITNLSTGIILQNTSNLTKNQILKIIVGQPGTRTQTGSLGNYSGLGGSGGSFIGSNNNTPLFIAGGSGGSGGVSFGYPGIITQTGGNAQGGGIGGQSGNGGTSGTQSQTSSAGGGGFFTNGTNTLPVYSTTGIAFISGGTGGTGSGGPGGDGGFGGGGGSGYGGGGGGGYSGGGGADIDGTGYPGGGGGSYGFGSNNSNNIDIGMNIGPGFVKIIAGNNLPIFSPNLPPNGTVFGQFNIIPTQRGIWSTTGIQYSLYGIANYNPGAYTFTSTTTTITEFTTDTGGGYPNTGAGTISVYTGTYGMQLPTSNVITNTNIPGSFQVVAFNIPVLLRKISIYQYYTGITNPFYDFAIVGANSLIGPWVTLLETNTGYTINTYIANPAGYIDYDFTSIGYYKYYAFIIKSIVGGIGTTASYNTFYYTSGYNIPLLQPPLTSIINIYTSNVSQTLSILQLNKNTGSITWNYTPNPLPNGMNISSITDSNISFNFTSNSIIPSTVVNISAVGKSSNINAISNGSQYTILQDGKLYNIHVFSNIGVNTLTIMNTGGDNGSGGGVIDLLLVAGGGGGGAGWEGGGGGGGGIIYQPNVSVSPGVYNIIVGAGGAGGGSNAYPPAAMNANSTIFSGLAYGNGTYISSASSEYGGGTQNQSAWSAFSKYPVVNAWTSIYQSYGQTATNPGPYGQVATYNDTTRNYSTTVNGTSYTGEWLQIQLPSAIILRSYSIETWGITSASSSGRSPNSWVVAGSTDGSTWNLVDQQTNRIFWPDTPISMANYGANTYICTGTYALNAYTYYRLCITKINFNSTIAYPFATIGAWTLYDTPYAGYAQQGGNTVFSNVSLFSSKNLISTSNSQLITAYGGGSGAAEQNQLGPTSYDATNGGSGGGGSWGTLLGIANIGYGIKNQGYNGGQGYGSPYVGGGGGGAGGLGTNATSSAAGTGGPGASNNITGSVQVYSGGGGGSLRGGSGGSGGIGGGGNGNGNTTMGSTNATVLDATYYGGGGGAAGSANNGNSSRGGNGYQGIAIIKYLSSQSNITFTINTGSNASFSNYAFSNFTFTNAGAVASNGPSYTQTSNYYKTYSNAASWIQYSSNFTMTSNGIQQWTVPITGTYTFIVAGAGQYNNGTSATSGMKYVNGGIVIKSSYFLTQGSLLYIAVGQQGLPTTSGGGGNGGSYVVIGSNTSYGIQYIPLIIAGGAGGYGDQEGPGIYGQLGTIGTPSITTRIIGGRIGYGGLSGQGGTYSDAGGGGFIGNGQNAIISGAIGGSSFINGSIGGGLYGGFGGGGGMAGESRGGGGGGGYSGGGGGQTNISGEGGGGGASYGSPYYSSEPIQYVTMNYGMGFIYVTYSPSANKVIPQYVLNTFTFTNAGVTGNIGPSLKQIQTTYLSSSNGGNWTQLTSNINCISGYQLLQIPQTGTYLITAAGAIGGNAVAYSNQYYTNLGGKGVFITSSNQFTAGDILTIIIGQNGTSSPVTYSGGGGGGGTLCIQNFSNLIIAAGGGGGAASFGNGIDANITTTGSSGANTNGGLIGFGGYGGSTYSGGTGGGGYLTNGGGCTGNNGYILGGNSYLQGYVGGYNVSAAVTYTGGFGGGGSGGGRTQSATVADGGGGGGGGYSGGGTGTYGGFAGGGGSYTSNQILTYGLNSSSSFNNGNGYLTITNLSTFTPSNIAGLGLWLDAADSSKISYTVTGILSNITQWTDKSYNTYQFTQSIINNQPNYQSNLLLKGGIKFSGSNWLTIASYNAVSFQNPNTIFFVLSGLNNPISVGSNAGGLLLYKGATNLAWSAAGYKKIWLGSTSNSGVELASGLYPSFVANSGDYSIEGYALNSNLPVILCLQTTNTNTISYYVNNIQVVNNNYNLSLNADTGSTLSIGSGGNANNLNLNIHEILHYNNSITDTDRTTLMVSLAIKWGISLPGYSLPVLVNPGTIYYGYSTNITTPIIIKTIQQSTPGLTVGPLIWYIGTAQSIQPLKIPGLDILSTTLPNGNGDATSNYSSYAQLRITSNIAFDNTVYISAVGGAGSSIPISFRLVINQPPVLVVPTITNCNVSINPLTIQIQQTNILAGSSITWSIGSTSTLPSTSITGVSINNISGLITVNRGVVLTNQTIYVFAQNAIQLTQSTFTNVSFILTTVSPILYSFTSNIFTSINSIGSSGPVNGSQYVGLQGLLGGAAFINTSIASSTTAILSLPGTSGSYVNLGNTHPTNFDLNTNNLFCEAWVYFNSFNSVSTTIIGRQNTTISPGEDWMLWINSAKQPQFRVVSSVVVQDASSTTVLSTGVWYHIAGSWNYSTKQLYVFINGVASSPTTFSGTPLNNSIRAVQIGIYTGGTNGQFMNGYIQDIRVIQGGTVPSATFTPATASFDNGLPSYSTGGTNVFSMYYQYSTQYNGFKLTQANIPTGGTISTIGGYRIHSFSTVGTTTFTTSSNITIDILVVAGGGGGGGWTGCGGGAGGLVYAKNYTIPPGTYNVVVGAGGGGGIYSSGGNGLMGAPSAFGGNIISSTNFNAVSCIGQTSYVGTYTFGTNFILTFATSPTYFSFNVTVNPSITSPNTGGYIVFGLRNVTTGVDVLNSANPNVFAPYLITEGGATKTFNYTFIPSTYASAANLISGNTYALFINLNPQTDTPSNFAFSCTQYVIYGTLPYIANGGGGGGYGGGSGGYIGGSGGGGGNLSLQSLITPGIGYGNPGAAGRGDGNFSAGGGGGAGDASISPNNAYANGGNGGIGKAINITGSNIYYAGGGGGGTYSTASAGVGGLGGGGSGATNSGAPTAGTANTGGGGGGSGNGGNINGAAGGSGIVIIRYSLLQTYNTQYFNTSNGIQYFIIPQTGTYNIVAAGASGGYCYGTTNVFVANQNMAARSSGYPWLPGGGSIISTTVTLTQGDLLGLVVGQVGSNMDINPPQKNYYLNYPTIKTFGAGGGGGATYIVKISGNNYTPILIAGGGGGAGTGNNGNNAVLTYQATNSTAPYSSSSTINTIYSGGTLQSLAYPPSAMNADSVTISGQSYGNGIYISSASSIYAAGNEAYRAFDKSGGSGGSGIWNSVYAYNSSGTPISSASTTAGGITYNGEWIQIQLPSLISLVSYSIQCRTDLVNQMPNTFVVLGSTDGSTWNLVDSRSGFTWTNGQTITFTLSSPSLFYNYYRYIVTTLNGTFGYTSVAEWILYGSSGGSGGSSTTTISTPGGTGGSGFLTSGTSMTLSPTIIAFTNIGTTAWTAPTGVTSIQVLVVAGGGGGGGGGNRGGGGGGAGGVIYNSVFSITPGTQYTVLVGSGGAGGPSGIGFNGGNSTFGSLTAIGGGAGGGNYGAGITGGSAGGGGTDQSTTVAGTAGQGNSGGRGAYNGGFYTAGGGGGAGGAGGSSTNNVASVGGVGAQYSISGVATYYAGGGGAAGQNAGLAGSVAAASLGGGGVGAYGGNGTANPAPGAVNGGNATYYGGGGGGGSTGGAGGSGYQGIVIISYTTTPTSLTGGISYINNNNNLGGITTITPIPNIFTLGYCEGGFGGGGAGGGIITNSQGGGGGGGGYSGGAGGIGGDATYGGGGGGGGASYDIANKILNSNVSYYNYGNGFIYISIGSYSISNVNTLPPLIVNQTGANTYLNTPNLSLNKLYSIIPFQYVDGGLSNIINVQDGLSQGNFQLEYIPTAMFNYKTGVTMEAWIYPTASSSGPGLFAANSSDNNGGSSWDDWWWGLQGLTPTFYISNGAANGATTISATANVTLNTWTHLAMTVDNSTSVIRHYINGTKYGETAWPSTYTTNQYGWKVHVLYGKNNQYIGYVYKMRITIGALYGTANFTAPTDLPWTSSTYYLLRTVSSYIPNSTLYTMSYPFTFTNMSATGSSGPTSITYSTSIWPGYGTGSQLTLGSGILAGMQLWIVPQTRSYTFTVAGAGIPAHNNPYVSGGGSTTCPDSYGMTVTTTLTLTAGTVIAICVGQQGLISPSGGISPGNFGQGVMGGAYGGCGGTFVVVVSGTVPLVVAGGSGGPGQSQNLSLGGAQGGSGTNNISGSDGVGGVGGTNGNGGGSGTVNSTYGSYTAAGGGGFSGNGSPPSYGSAAGGFAFINGATGANGYGGFGGGGGVGGQCMGGGGGGGYSGGGAGGTAEQGKGGGGGGSYVTSLSTYSPGTITYNANNTGMGYVTIS